VAARPDPPAGGGPLEDALAFELAAFDVRTAAD
jgi:hypothetical protein